MQRARRESRLCSWLKLNGVGLRIGKGTASAVPKVPQNRGASAPEGKVFRTNARLLISYRTAQSSARSAAFWKSHFSAGRELSRATNNPTSSMYQLPLSRYTPAALSRGTWRPFSRINAQPTIVHVPLSPVADSESARHTRKSTKCKSRRRSPRMYCSRDIPLCWGSNRSYSDDQSSRFCASSPRNRTVQNAA
jgi:hypothetical protein